MGIDYRLPADGGRSATGTDGSQRGSASRRVRASVLIRSATTASASFRELQPVEVIHDPDHRQGLVKRARDRNRIDAIGCPLPAARHHCLADQRYVGQTRKEGAAVEVDRELEVEGRRHRERIPLVEHRGDLPHFRIDQEVVQPVVVGAQDGFDGPLQVLDANPDPPS